MYTSLSGQYSCACHPHVLRVNDAKGAHYVPYAALMYLEATQRYTVLHCEGMDPLSICFNLGYFEKLLPSCFFRVHKSHIVNLHYIKLIDNERKVHLDTQQKHKIWMSADRVKEYNSAYNAWNTHQVEQQAKQQILLTMLDNLCAHFFLNIPQVGKSQPTQPPTEPPTEPPTDSLPDTPENPFVQ